MRKKFLIFFKYYFPLIIWTGGIFYFSSIPGLRYTKNTPVEIFLRKGAHFFEYAVLVWLFWRIFHEARKKNPFPSYVLSLFFSLFYAASDEIHQAFVLNRSGKLTDVIFDWVSALFFLETILIIIGRKIKKKNILVIAASILVLVGLEYQLIREERIKAEIEIQNGKSEKETENIDKTEIIIIPSDQNQAEAKPNNSVSEKLPDKILMEVPFTAQAPFKNWDEYHEEACEEAALLMVKYFSDSKKLSPEIAEKEIQAMIDFQLKKYGDYRDSAASQIVKLAEDFYVLENLKVVYDFQKEDLKRWLAKGKPIIVPAAGRLLGNPNFTYPGPLYHNLVLTGYEGREIITNDPGTRQGENYRYDEDVLYEAIHDFPGKKEEINKGRKAMIVME